MTTIPGKLEFWETKTQGTSIVAVSRCSQGFGVIRQIGWLWI